MCGKILRLMCAQGGQRVTVVTASFQDCLLGGDPAGVLALNQRLLEAVGQKVVVVRFTDWPVADNLVARSVALDSYSVLNTTLCCCRVKILDERFKKLVNQK